MHLKLRESLRYALRSLRRIDEPRALWVDALCIDQACLKEKERQVLLMRQIYHSAHIVLIWLGREARLSGRAIPALEDLVTDLSDEQALAVIASRQDKWNQFSELESCTMLDWLAWIAHFAYWKRLWVVQEVAVAKTPTIICGQYVLPFDTMIKAYERLCLLEPTLDSTYYNIYTVFSNIEEKMGLIRDCRRLPNLKLQEVVTMCQGQHASDSRDKIYGCWA